MMILDSLPFCGEHQSTLIETNPEDWIYTPFMMDLLDREGLPATAPAPVEDETTSPVEPPAPEGVFSPPLPPAEEKVDQASDSNATQPYEPHVDYEPVVAAPSLEMEADWFL